MNINASQITENWTVCLSVLGPTAKESSKLHISGLLWGKSTIDRWIPLTKGHYHQGDRIFHIYIQRDTRKAWAYQAGPWFNIKKSSYQYRKSHCGDKTILRPSYLHNGISYTGKTTSLYWISPLVSGALGCPWCGATSQRIGQPAYCRCPGVNYAPDHQ